jgi:hypothetical protein
MPAVVAPIEQPEAHPPVAEQTEPPPQAEPMPQPEPPLVTQLAIVRAVGGREGLFLEAHCDSDTWAREHDVLALMREEPGRATPTFVGLVDVVRVRDSRFVAVALGGKPAVGDTLLIEAPQTVAIVPR